jgi:hypothetical protein
VWRPFYEGCGMRDEPLKLRGSSVQALPKRNRVWSKDRTCAEDGCITRISIYNRSRYCWMHEPVRYYIPRGRKKSPQAA